MKPKIIIIGSGFSALSASCYLAKNGCDVTIYEKNSTIGGRAGQLKRNGFTFDLGPSWYWMPDVFDRFFMDFHKKTSDFYDLEKLDPAYKIFFRDDIVTIGEGMDQICKEFERIETGSSVPLRKFIAMAEENYKIAMHKIVLRPGVSPLELICPETLSNLNRFFTTIGKEVRKRFKNPKLIAALEFPILFLGARPNKTPAFYNFMNYADFGMGTWHPKGGMYQIIKAMESLAKDLGINIKTDRTVTKINVQGDRVTGIQIDGRTITADIVLSGADYHHSESLLPPGSRQYSEAYWDKRTFAPSALLFYVAFGTKLQNIAHHNLFFDTDFERHASEIYDNPQWPKDPLFYANFPSINDSGMAPAGCENGFFLIPIAPNLKDTPELREKYYGIIMERFQQLTGQCITDKVLFKESFCVGDFKERYNAYKGNAYGMANTLMQTAFLRPKLQSGKLRNLFFTGQLTVPGPGVPPALISGKLVSELILKYLNAKL